MSILNKTKLSGTDNSINIEINGVEETIELGALIGPLLRPGDVVALVGRLGAGKTYLTKGIAEGLGIDGRKLVTSPSYVLINQYEGNIPIYHFDAYRLKSPGEMYDIDCVEYFEGDGISIVEWADKVMECMPEAFIEISFRITNQTSREITVTYKGERYRSFIKRLKEKVKCLK